MKSTARSSPETTPKRARSGARRTLEPATLSEARGVRYLHLGTPWIQGAMRRSRPLAIELEYVRRMMVWMLMVEPETLGRADDTGEIATPAQGHAVQLGLGAAALTKYCHGVLGMATTAVELNPTVIDACHLWFALPPDDERLQVLEMNAAAWVADPAHAGTVRVLTVDLYDHEAASPVLDDTGFYRDCRSVLESGGLMTVNLFGRDSSFAASARHIEIAFGAGNVWSLPPNRDGNTIVLAGKDMSWPDADTLRRRGEFVENRFGFPGQTWARMIEPLPLLPGVVDDHADASAPSSKARARRPRRDLSDRSEQP